MLLTDADQLRKALALAMRERDEAQAAFAGAENSLTAEREHSARLSRECQERHDELRAEVERLKADNSVMGNYWSFAAALRDVAERQREACAERMRLAVDVNAEHLCRATPLVTEGES